MNQFNFLPSVNWNISRMFAVNEAGTMCAYGSRGDIIIVDNIHQDTFDKLDAKFIPRAHKNSRVSALSFMKHEMNDRVVESIVSCGEDGFIKLWNPETQMSTHKFLIRKIDPSVKFVDIDTFPSISRIVSIAEEKLIVKWDLQKNKVKMYSLDCKEKFTCIAACPHEDDLIAIGARLGLVLIYCLNGDGKLKHKIPCHTRDVFSVSWCPVPYNAFALPGLREDPSFIECEWKEKDRTLLLASCSKDRSICVSKAGTTGYCEALLTLPSRPVIASHNSRLSTNRVQNVERGRFFRWIQPLVFITHTEFNEMVYARVSPKAESKGNLVHNLKLDVKLLHNFHQSSISNFAIQLFEGDDLNFRVWSCSTDRLIVRCGYRINHKEKPFVLPLLSGFIFAIDIAPTTLDRLAIGTGDGKICLWNMSSENFVDVTTLSNKIMNSKIMSLKWHPHEEGILAFGTYEGRVGIFDVSMGSKTSWMFKVYHHKPIYKLCWGPAVFVDSETSKPKNKFRGNLFLFAVGNGDILQFNPNDVNETPRSLSSEIFTSIEEKCGCKYKTEMSLERDRPVFAVGLSNGDVCIFSSETYKLQYVIKEQPKSIMSLAWHPKRVFDLPDENSAYSNWLATAGENVFVYDIDPNSQNAPKKVASLELHTNRILDVVWNPHINGRLMSCSADSTVIIWDVISQTVIGRYVKHCAQVLCGVWSLTNKDVVITGSSDFTCRMWSLSKDLVASNVKELKKIIEKPIEPVVVNSSVGANEHGDSVAIAPHPKNNKPETFLPSISADIHTCPILDRVVKRIIDERQTDGGDSSISDTSLTNGHDSFTQDEESLVSIHHSTSATDDSIFESFCQEGQSLMNGHDAPLPKEDGSKSSQKKNLKRSKLANSEHNYSQLFGSKDELLRLVNHEENFLEKLGSKNSFILFQARHDLKTKITEAIEKNQVTEYMLTLASSISPKLWKDACQVYIEQLLQADQLMQAVNYLLALNRDEEVIDLLCDKKRFKEAFAIARLRFDDDTACNKVLEKWSSFCFNCGLYRLGAHCHLFLKDEEKAALLLNKSKNFQDLTLAAKLLKPYQRDRAIELAADSVKRHLQQITLEDLQDLLTSFPEIKFTKAWYLSLKYLTKEHANTASITKWVIGLSKDNDDLILKSIKDVDFEKLQRVIVGNTFNMNFEELTKYVSAQIALYVSGMSNPDSKQTALRHYIRGLHYCYNFKIINSNKILSDSAYPTMKLLQLTFPNGVISPINKEKEIDPALKVLMKSVNGYFCEFVVTWLIGCDELPKSLKVKEKNSLTDSEENHVEIMAAFSVIKDPRKKLEKINEILTIFIEDILDVEVTQYLQYTVKVKQFDSGSFDQTVDDSTKAASKDEKIDMADKSGLSRITSAEMKMYRESIDKFERERVAAPNPYLFYCSVRDYLNKSESTDSEIVSELQLLLNKAARVCGFLKN